MSKARATRIQAVLSFAALCALVATRIIASSLLFAWWRLSASATLGPLRLLDAPRAPLLEHLAKGTHEVICRSGESELGDVLIAMRGASALFCENCGDVTSANSWKGHKPLWRRRLDEARTSRRRRWPGRFPGGLDGGQRPRRARRQRRCHCIKRAERPSNAYSPRCEWDPLNVCEAVVHPSRGATASRLRLSLLA